MRPIKLPASAALALGIILGAPTANAAVIFGSTSLTTNAAARVGFGVDVVPRQGQPAGNPSVTDSDAGSLATQTLATNATARACPHPVANCTQTIMTLSAVSAYADARVTADVGDDGSTLNLDYQAKLVEGLAYTDGTSATASADFLFTYAFEVLDISTFTRTWAVDQRERQGDAFTEFDPVIFSFSDGVLPVVDRDTLYSALATNTGDVFAGFLGSNSGSDSFIIQPGVYTFSIYTGDSIRSLLSGEDVEPGDDHQWKMRTEVGNFSFSITPFTAAAVPEPETWALLILGFGAAGHALRRRRPRIGQTHC